MRAILLLCVVLVTGPLFAQSTEADLKTRLVGQPLFLRGEWASDKLKFNANGQLLGSSKTVPFTVSGINVSEVKLDAKGLTIEGKRMGLEFNWDQISRVDMKGQTIKVHVDRPADGDYGHALDAVFARLPELVPTMPMYWQTFAQQHFVAGSGAKAEDTVVAKQIDSSARRIGVGVTAPRVLTQPSPEYDPQARAQRVSGKVLVYLQVDDHGKPNSIRILHPLGFGLDEKAVDAVSRYKFSPAEENGKPVRVEMHVEVAFMIFP